LVLNRFKYSAGLKDFFRITGKQTSQRFAGRDTVVVKGGDRPELNRVA
jgi:hypothetical protein